MATDLPPPDCPLGYPRHQVENLVDDLAAFGRWMRGQTVMLCEGRRYDYETREWVPDACAGIPHGTVVYGTDIRRYLARQDRIRRAAATATAASFALERGTK